MPPSRTRDAKVPCPHPGCQSIFLARDLPRHLRTHLSPEQRRAYEYECKACGHRSLQKVNVVQHIISKHVNDRFHECLYPGEPACNLTFTTSSIRTKHRNDAHPPDTEYPVQNGASDRYSDWIITPEAYRDGRACSISPSSSLSSVTSSSSSSSSSSTSSSSLSPCSSFSSVSSSSSSTSSTSSSSSSSRHRARPSGQAPRAVPASVMPASMDPHFSSDYMVHTSLTDMTAMYPVNHSHHSPHMPVDMSSFNGTYVPPHPDSWLAQQSIYAAQNSYEVQQPFENAQRWVHNHPPPRHGHSSRHH
ncbi:hypothetical protein OH76DRAFT_632030 [Lentinus brumalis]|uniref:C2H2-type domain-containing protein n=1 Tax=Lentinus brumalis TaxID=2498619 RepID=A0A371D8G6_9APHY|nr:hypothetical protein OH76DRAFT_632030 [Polyporus brumalis]